MYADTTLMDLAAAYAKRRNGRKTKHAVACDRPGAKAEMGKFNSGDTVVVPYGREMVRGKIVRYDEPAMAYVVDIGRYESIKVAKEDVRKASMSRPGAKAKMGLLDRLGAAASALAGPGKDPTTQEYKTSVAEAKKAAIDEVKNYAFMVKQNDQKLAALDAYVKSTSKAIATLNSAPEILRLTDGLRQAVKARSVLLQTLKMPFGRKAQFAERDLVYGPEASRIWDKLEGVWKDIDKAIRPLGRELRRLERVAKGTPLEGSVAAMIKAVEEAMTTQQLQPFKAPQEPNKGPNDVYVDKLHKYLDREEKRRAAVITLADKARALMQQVAAAKPTKAARGRTRADLENEVRARQAAEKAREAYRTMKSKGKGEAKPGKSWTLKDLGIEEMKELKLSRPGAKSTHAALPPQTLEAERKPGGGSHSEAVSRKIATLINEGKPQDQAVAIALDLERRGEL